MTINKIENKYFHIVHRTTTTTTTTKPLIPNKLGRLHILHRKTKILIYFCNTEILLKIFERASFVENYQVNSFPSCFGGGGSS
jgi:hypothetical protein